MNAVTARFAGVVAIAMVAAGCTVRDSTTDGLVTRADEPSDEMTALVGGRLAVDGDCFLLSGLPVVWPAGTMRSADGSSIELGPTLREVAEELADDYGIPRADVWQDGLLEGIASYGEYGPYGGYSEPGLFDPDQRMPAEPVDPARIATIVAAEVDPTCCIGIIAMMDRSALELKLRQSIWTAVIGLLLGGAVAATIHVAEAERLLAAGELGGGIVPKLQAAVVAARGGVDAAIGATAVLA